MKQAKKGLIEMLETDFIRLIDELSLKLHDVLESHIQNMENVADNRPLISSFEMAGNEWIDIQKMISFLSSKYFSLPCAQLSEKFYQIIIALVKVFLQRIHHWSTFSISYLESTTHSDLIELFKEIVTKFFDRKKNMQQAQVLPKRALTFETGDDLSLTTREKQCLQLYMKGLSAKLAAKELNISHRTVEFYLARIKKKFNSKNLREVVYQYQQKNPSD